MTARLAAMALAAAALAGCAAAPPVTPVATEAPNACRIVRVVDGDTVDLVCAERGATRARLVGYDTPEVFSPGCRAEAALGYRAAQRLRALAESAGRTEVSYRGADRYGRALVRVQLDGVDVARTMIAEGLAVRYAGGRRIDWCRRLAA